jgi:hypothetical protein
MPKTKTTWSGSETTADDTKKKRSETKLMEADHVGTRAAIDSRMNLVEEAKTKPVTTAFRALLLNTRKSPYKLAPLAGITPPAVYRFLTGQGGLSLEVLDKLSIALGIEFHLQWVGYPTGSDAEEKRMEMVISPKTAVVFPPGTEVEPQQTTTKDQTKPRAREVPTVRSTVKERRRKLEDKEGKQSEK